MVDPIRDSIEAVLGSVDKEGGPNFDEFYPHANRSPEFQRLALAHISKFYASDTPIPDRLILTTTHAFWLGFESGRAATRGEKMEAMFA